MRSDNLRLMTVAIACSVAQDVAAYEMLQQNYIDGFLTFFQERKTRRQQEGETATPSILEEMIHYAIREVPSRLPDCASLSDLLSPAKRIEITDRFLYENMGTMLTSLAKRERMRDSIRQLLHSLDTKRMYAVIESTKFEAVFAEFIDMFEKNCTSGFEFSGSFLGYVIHCFTDYFYTNRLRDIWQMLGSVDYLKREAETNMTAVTMLTPQRSDDLLVHDLFVNINRVNDLLFKHPGQTPGARGVCYDIFYMVILYLCENHLAIINSSLSGFQLKLIDERDRRETRNGLAENKGIANKIINARELIPVLFEHVRQGNWTLDNMLELRDEAFSLGKKDRDGRNCVWKDVEKNAETNRYFDMADSAHNYNAFNCIFKGVMSVYALATAFEERGMYLVDTYDMYPKMFENKSISRTIGYISDIQHAGLILKLQQEGDAHPESDGELLTFDLMVNEYAGSEHNNHAHIREYRYEAYTEGLLEATKLKQQGKLQTPFSRLQSVDDYLSALPRSFEEYVQILHHENRLPTNFAPAAIIQPEDVTGSKYNSLYCNRYFAENPELSSYYLYYVARKERRTSSLEWHLGTSLFTGVLLERIVFDEQHGQYIERHQCVYIPMIDRFLLCPLDVPAAPGRLLCKDIYELSEIVASAVYNGQRNAALTPIYDVIPSSLFSVFLHGDSHDESHYDYTVGNSIGFDSYLGISNYRAPETTARLKSIPVYREYRSSVERYSDWMGHISELQHSFIELLQLMWTYGLYLTRSSTVVAGGNKEQYGRQLILSLLKMEFTESNLQWFFDELNSVMDRMAICKVDMHWDKAATNTLDFEDVDLSILKVIYNEDTTSYEEDSFEYDMYLALRDYTTAPQRFVQLYNFLNSRLGYLRMLRDSYDLVFNIIVGHLSSLGCELNSRFKIEAVLNSSRDNAGSGGMFDQRYALIDTINTESILQYVSAIRQNNWRNFAVLTKDLLGYFQQCRSDLSSLVDYDVTGNADVRSGLQNYGGVFITLGGYSDMMVRDIIQEMRTRLRTDDAGFFLSKTSYFKGRSGQSEFYVHSTGRILEVRGSKVEPKSFDFSNEMDRKQYEHIILDGKKRNGW